IAAQSIGEPGTQLTMRTFHTGGIAAKDITSGLPRVEELFEARSPKGKARLAEIDGEVLVFEGGSLVGEYEAPDDSPQVVVPPASVAPVVRVVNRVPFTDAYEVPEGFKMSVKNGQHIAAGQPIAEAPKPKKGEEAPALTAVLARVTGTARVDGGVVEIDTAEVEVRDHVVDATDQRLVRTGDEVYAGQKLTNGVKDPHDILRIEGMESTQRYLVEQVQTVYRNQGVTINDKHIETIIRQILRWVRVESVGDTGLLPNQLIDRLQFQEANAKVMAEGGEPATSKPEILGVTRASLNTDSFLAKASFQETTRVLTEAALMGDVDYLRGLKENVIIGRLIPARLDISEEGRAVLGLPPQPATEEPEDALDEEELLSLMAELPTGPEGDEAAPAAGSDDDDDDDDDLLLDDGDDDFEDDLADEPETGEAGESEEE
ncbi:MAG: hypothetical protein VW450_07405, partial [Chloroflexota bacterium]